VFFSGLAWTILFVLFAFVMLGLVSSAGIQSQEIGWEECLRSDLFCAEWDVKP